MKGMDTVAAVSTPSGKGGVALIRISGPDAVRVGGAVFEAKSGRPLSEQASARLCYGEIVGRDENGARTSIDDGMAVVFRAPHSFTGEDTVEITCHGGILVTREVLGAILRAGARHAEAGEFTRRAFLNGKMHLTEAEALGQLLEAQTTTQMRLARGGMQGRLAERMTALYDSLRTVMASVLAAIDFPEEDLAEMSREEMADALEDVRSGLRALGRTYGTGRAISEGIPTVICGAANAGKSSVYNRILGYDAAIVTDVEGTTRDVLRETATLGKTTLLLCDTAGLRDTADPVESIGIARSRREIEQAGLILAVFDGSQELSEVDRALADELAASGIPRLALWNKTDRAHSLPDEDFCACFDGVIPISAKDGDGFDRLAERVDALFIDGSLDVGRDAVITGARQYAAVCRAEEALSEALADLVAGVPLDLCCVGIECAMSCLGELDGREIGEEIVSEIFSKFCVGK